MSVFGGDSWAREAQHRKRRLDDLLLPSSSSSSSFKRLSNGKYACLVCPQNPVLDSPLALSMHTKGSRHIAAASKLKERKLSRQEELNKRIALSSDSLTASNSNTPVEQLKGLKAEQLRGPKAQNQPLIEQTKKAILEAVNSRSWDQNSRLGSFPKTLNASGFSSDSKTSPSPNHISELPNSTTVAVASGNMLTVWNDELHKRHEKELKFTAAGWKRDGFGKWYKDENVEFDSDDEDPNVCLEF